MGKLENKTDKQNRNKLIGTEHIRKLPDGRGPGEWKRGRDHEAQTGGHGTVMGCKAQHRG